jgi:hypothetical protein
MLSLSILFAEGPSVVGLLRALGAQDFRFVLMAVAAFLGTTPAMVVGKARRRKGGGDPSRTLL